MVEPGRSCARRELCAGRATQGCRDRRGLHELGRQSCRPRDATEGPRTMPTPPPRTGSRHARRRPPITQARRLVSTVLTLFGLASLLLGAVAGAALSSDAQAAVAHAVNQCNGTDNVGGQAVACNVTITNNLDLATNVGTSTTCGSGSAMVLRTQPRRAPPTRPRHRPGHLGDPVRRLGQWWRRDGRMQRVHHQQHHRSVDTQAGDHQPMHRVGPGGGTEPTLACTRSARPLAPPSPCDESGNGGGGTIRVSAPSPRPPGLRAAGHGQSVQRFR